MEIKYQFGVPLVILIVSIIINTPLYNQTVWYIVDILTVLLAVAFTLVFAKKSKKTMALTILVWLPALVVFYMTLEGLLTVDHPIWLVSNMYQLALYGYLLGTMCCCKESFWDR